MHSILYAVDLPGAAAWAGRTSWRDFPFWASRRFILDSADVQRSSRRRVHSLHLPDGFDLDGPRRWESVVVIVVGQFIGERRRRRWQIFPRGLSLYRCRHRSGNPSSGSSLCQVQSFGVGFAAALSSQLADQQRVKVAQSGHNHNLKSITRQVNSELKSPVIFETLKLAHRDGSQCSAPIVLSTWRTRFIKITDGY